LRRIKASVLFFNFAIGVELLEISPQIDDLLGVGDAGESHFGTRDFGRRAADIIFEGCLVPDNTRVLIGVGIVEACDGAGVTTVETIELGTDFVRGSGSDGVTGQAFIEGALALFRRPAPRPFATSQSWRSRR
jgi:hypothetical protein